MSKNKKVIVGVSGGIDSSVALLLLKKQGYEPVAVSLKYNVWNDPANLINENVCCSEESFEIARHVCKKLDIEYHIIDCSKEFEKQVVEYFKSELKNNKTPNPCVVCNRALKFKHLLEFADKKNIEFVATGHYAQTKKDGNNHYLSRAKDKNKDQTYTLSFLKKQWLPRILFPLGQYTKKQVTEIASEAGFEFYQKRQESQDFCFIHKKEFKKFLEKEIGTSIGPIKNEKGDRVGEHKGLHFYTIGQRKGIDVPNGPHFVTGYDIEKNTLLISRDKESPHLYSKEITLSPYNLLINEFKKPMKVQAKTRYQQKEEHVIIYPINNNELKLEFKKPHRAITPGQYAVIYDNDKCIASGRINKIG